MTKAEMVAKLAEVVNIQKKQAEKVLTELVGMIKASLMKGERIALTGLGSFSTTARKARTARNPTNRRCTQGTGQEGGQVLSCGACQEGGKRTRGREEGSGEGQACSEEGARKGSEKEVTG